MIELKQHFTRDLDDVAEFDGLARMLAWWRSAGAPPNVSAFSPLVVPRELLPDAALFDIEPPPRRYRVRLMGTAMADHFGEDATGRYVDEIFSPAAYEVIRDGFDQAVDTARPHFAGRVYNTAKGKELSFSRLALPFADAHGRIVRLLSASLLSKPTHAYSDIYRQARRSVVVTERASVV